MLLSPVKYWISRYVYVILQSVRLTAEANPFMRSINLENSLGIVTQVTYIGKSCNQQFMSDIAGQDIQAHNDSSKKVCPYAVRR